ncbi:HPr kinase/phosphorylase [Shimia sp.]|uniref:HPr kinase/phosphorylase n=1 Tax=Shimia sp. TaxID=1954381 RepID=UPI00356A9A82
MTQPGGNKDSLEGGAAPLILHASCVSLGARGVLILGASGRGKSSLALQLMALGARLVSDDRTALHRQGGRIMAEAPAAIRGLIEARGVGLLRAEPAGATEVVMVIDLDQEESARLPPLRRTEVLGRSLPLLHAVPEPYFPAAILQMLAHGRRAP